jgi:hypothetical protein
MGFEGEFARYEPLRRLRESEKVQAFESRFRLRQVDDNTENFERLIINRSSLSDSSMQPDLVLAIDGSYIEATVKNGFPCAEIGYITIASVLIDIKKNSELEKEKFIDPKKLREAEKASTIESVFPGCNVILDAEKSAKASFRRGLFEELKGNTFFSECETLLDTYEYLLRIKQQQFGEKNPPPSPIDGYEDESMTYGYGEYICPHSGESLFSTDALRLHSLMNDGSGNGEMFGQTMATFEKLWFIHILRSFEQKGWLSTLRRIAFVLDGPLAVFSTSSWLTKVISYEIRRINELQKQINSQDLLIIGIEKTGTFVNHFEAVDTTEDGTSNKFPKQSALLLDDDYIKKNVIFRESGKMYGLDTYFGRKIFYKTAIGQRMVLTLASYNDYQSNLFFAKPDQFSRLADVMNLLDMLFSNQYPNAFLPLVSAHAEAAIPLSLGKKIFEDIAKEIRER